MSASSWQSFVLTSKIYNFFCAESARSIQNFIVDQFYDEPNITHTDMFGRNSRMFEPWDSFRNGTAKHPVRSFIRQYEKVKFKRSKMIRKDEPELAAFIYANSFSIVEDYLVGPPRRPFYKSRGNFIIVITEALQLDWKESAAAILEILWRDYRVFNALVMTPCEEDQVCRKDICCTPN